MRSSSASTRDATSAQSVLSALRSATSRLVRIDASGLRSSCDASDTNCRCFCDDTSRRASIAFIVRARRPTSSSVSGSGTRRCIVVPVISSARSRMASTGRSARPVKYQVANAISATRSGTAISSASRTEFDRAVHLGERRLREEPDVAGLCLHVAVRGVGTRIALRACAVVMRQAVGAGDAAVDRPTVTGRLELAVVDRGL